MKRTMTGLAIGLAAVLLAGTVGAAAVWDGGGANVNWDTADNWDDNSVPATSADVSFATGFGSGTAISLNGNRTANSLTIDTNATFSLNNNTLTLTSGNVTMTTNGSLTLNSAVSIGGAAGAWNVATNGYIQAGGIISGSGSITKTGPGELRLNAVNTLSGTVRVEGGKLTIGHANALTNGTLDTGPSGGQSVSCAVAGIRLGGLEGSDNLATYGRDQAMYIGANNQDTAFSGSLSGETFCHKVGSGTLTLSGANNATKQYYLDAGTLRVGASGVQVFGQDQYATVIFANAAGVTLDLNNQAVIPCRGLHGGGSNGGNVTNLGGTLNLKVNYFMPGPGIGYLDTATYNGTIAGTGGISIVSGGVSAGNNTKQVFTGANTYQGITRIQIYTLNISNSAALGSTDGGTIVSSSAALELHGSIAVGAEALTLSGAGPASGGALRNVSGNNSWAGPITLAAASRINSDSGTLTLDVAAGDAIAGTYNLTLGGAGNVTVADPIATGAGTLTKDGTGTLTLRGASTYTGLTTVQAGTLLVNNATGSGTGSGNLTVTNGATLGGTGVVAGVNHTVTFLAGGKLAPGGTNAIGTLTFDQSSRNESGFG